MAIPNAIGYAEYAAPQQDREQLILEHLPQVRWVAQRFHERLPDSVSLDDLISIGIIGLINAIDSFDPSFNVKLKTYAEHKIRGAILDSLRGMDGIPPHKRKRMKEIQRTLESLEQRLQRPPEEEEVAAELGISHREYQEALLELRAVSIGSLDAPLGEGDARSVLYYVADREDNSPSWALERSELEKVIHAGLDKMPRNEKLVLDLYYRQGMNIREIAPILDLHITRISQIKAQAILRLRNYMEKRWPSPRGVF